MLRRVRFDDDPGKMFPHQITIRTPDSEAESTSFFCVDGTVPTPKFYPTRPIKAYAPRTSLPLSPVRPVNHFLLGTSISPIFSSEDESDPEANEAHEEIMEGLKDLKTMQVP